VLLLSGFHCDFSGHPYIRRMIVNRRKFLTGAGVAALVVGFESSSGAWLSRAQASQASEWSPIPKLDGTLSFALADRQADSEDLGRIVEMLPAAVLMPGSVDDIQVMIRFCHRHGIPVSTRGQGHTTNGQGLTSGLIIQNSSLNAIHSIGPDGAVVDAGVLWRDLVNAAVPMGLTPPLFTTYTGLSIAGTLSVGGFPAMNELGLQIEHVSELQVVTGTGELVTCSPRENRGLFEAMLGGLGQCGVITRATIDMVPAVASAQVCQLNYPISATTTMFSDLWTLLDRGDFTGVYTLIFVPPGMTELIYQINAVSLYDQAQPPDPAALLSGLSQPAAAATVTQTSYLDWVLRYDPIIAEWRAELDWNNLIKPWYDAILTGSTIESYVSAVMPTLTPADFGPPTGIGFLFPQKRGKLTRRFFRLPPDDGSGWVILFDILTSSAVPAPDPAFTQAMAARNGSLFYQARDLCGATRYPIGTIDMTQEDWRIQYGESWPEFSRLKHRYDPGLILAHGPGIFTPGPGVS
jgi:cytokinin dehydrogenase